MLNGVHVYAPKPVAIASTVALHVFRNVVPGGREFYVSGNFKAETSRAPCAHGALLTLAQARLISGHS